MPRAIATAFERRPATSDLRFWMRVWPRGDCWEWRGSFQKHGYGVLSSLDNTLLAHRYAYESSKGTIPVGMTIDHLCRHKWCVRPSHLEAVTMAVNVLRGGNACAKNSRKTHCPRGHEYYRYTLKDGSVVRKCRTCKRARDTGSP